MPPFISDDQLDQALKAFRSTDAALGAERRERISSRISTQIDRDVAAQDGPVVSDVEHRRLKSWTVGLGAVASLLVVALVSVLVRVPSKAEVVAGPAPISRDDLVVAASGSADHRLLSGTQLYRRVLVARRHGPRTVIVRTTETWVGADGSGKLEASAESVLDGPASDEIRLAPKLGVKASAGELDFAGLSYAQLRGLPADGRQLLGEVESRVRTDDPSSVAVASLLAELLSLDVAPPEVRAAAVDAIFEIGAAGVGRVRAPDGRLGEALLGRDATGRQWVLIVDHEAKAMAFIAGSDSLWSGGLKMNRADNWTTFGATALTRIGD